LIPVQRAYYYCRSCGKGNTPWDVVAGLTPRRLTPAVERLTTLCGAVADSFEKGTELLRETTGIRLSESTVERTTEAAGERIAEVLWQGRGLGKTAPWDWHRDATGQTVGYVAVDATGIRQQGPGGQKAEGRMTYVGMIFNPKPPGEWETDDPVPPGEPMKARYVSGLYSLTDLGFLMRKQGAQTGLGQAKVWIALSDGGSGLEDFLRVNFPQTRAIILDFYHAAEHLGKLAKAAYPQDEERAKSQTGEWARLLRAQGGDALIAVLEAWVPPRMKSLASVREEVLTSFRNQRHRMDYPTYDANGWSIGSGAVESACKTVVGQRMKGSGMRWSESGGHAVCQVRALYRSEQGQWDAFWQRDLAA
jgi:hypothetical protein